MGVGTGVYKVSGRNEIFILENNKWRYISTEGALFQAGYSWADVQTIPIEEWCKYEVGSPMPGGWADPGNYGYVPHKDWYVTACAIVPPPPPEKWCGKEGRMIPESEWTEARCTVTPPPNGVPLPIPPPYKIAFSTPISWFPKVAYEMGCNLVQQWNEWSSDATISNAATEALKNGMQLLSHCSTEDNVAKYTARFNTHKDNPGIWGWQVEEPQMRSISVDALRRFYSTAKSINPNWKIFCDFGFSEWLRRGYVVGDIFDIFGVNIYSDGDQLGIDVGRFKDAILKLIDTYGKEWCPLIASYGDSIRGPKQLEGNYHILQQVIGRPLAGLAYYEWPRWRNYPDVQRQIKEVNQLFGGYSPVLRIVTIKTIYDGAGALIEYKFSSIATENVPLTSPYDNQPLGVKGIAGSEVIKSLSRIIERVRAEIAQLVIDIARIQSEITSIQAEIIEIKKLLGI